MLCLRLTVNCLICLANKNDCLPLLIRSVTCATTTPTSRTIRDTLTHSHIISREILRPLRKLACSSHVNCDHFASIRVTYEISIPTWADEVEGGYLQKTN